MADPTDALNNEVQSERNNGGWIERKVPVAVIFLLVCQIITGIWFFSAFYTQQQEMDKQFTKSFTGLNQQITEMEKSIYTRQEATISLENIRQINARQDSDIRELNNLFRQLLLETRSLDK